MTVKDGLTPVIVGGPGGPRPGRAPQQPVRALAPRHSLTQQGYLTFQGIGFGTHKLREFTALCGDEPPTVTDGYAIWQPTTRPLARAVTVFQSYNPATLQVNIRLGRWDLAGWHTGAAAGQQVETDIGVLEWMGGSNFQEGPSPVVYMSAYTTKSSADSPLIPQAYQGKPWVINGGITWGKSYRNDGGQRVYQEAAFALLQYIGFSDPPAQQSTAKGGYFRATKAINTPLKIAGASSGRSPVAFQQNLATRIKNSPRNKKLRLRSVNSKIKPGAKVWVPAHAE